VGLEARLSSHVTIFRHISSILHTELAADVPLAESTFAGLRAGGYGSPSFVGIMYFAR